MKSFNKIFKEIILQNEFYVENQFPDAFSFSDYGLEFIFDIMPTFSVKYVWHTLQELKSIPELINTLKNTDQNILDEIANGFYDQADSQEDNAFNNEFPDEQMKTGEEFRAIGNWIKDIKNDQTAETIMEGEQLNIHDSQCFNTVPNVVKEVTPRPYRRGLKALSLANRKKFNQEHLTNIEPKPITDIINKVKDPQIVQQPISKDVIKPQPGVQRPLGLNRTQKKNTFSNLVYHPSITQITKETAKKRCIAQRATKNICKEDTDDNELEFTTNYSQSVKPHVPVKPLNNAQLPVKKELCIICKQYVQPKESTLCSGKKIYECPKCGLRLPESNY